MFLEEYTADIDTNKLEIIEDELTKGHLVFK